MRFYTNTLFLLILTTFYSASAQTNSTKIVGQIANLQNYSIQDVTVYLLRSADSSLVRFAVSDRTGAFEFANLKPDTYLIRVASIGYIKTTTHAVVLKAGNTIDVGIIKISKSNTNLGQVDIVSSKPFIEVKPGKVVLNVQNSILANGSNALDILKKTAGIKIASDNTISLNGKENVLVLIDNKPTYMPPDALIDMLQGTQSTSIDQIELIDNPGAKYDAANGGAVINIKTLRNKNYGTNGTANIGLGVQQVESGHPQEFKEASGFTFNSRTKNLDIHGSDNFSYTPVNRIYLTDRFVNYNNQLTEINANYFSDETKASNVYLLGADYDITPKQVIGVLIKGITTNFVLNKTTNSSVIHSGVTDSTVATNSNLENTTWQFAADLNYKITLNKKSDISADADYFTYNRSPLENITSLYYKQPANYLYRTLNIQNSFPSNYKIYSFNVNYDVNFSATSSLTMILKTSNVKTHNNLNFGEIVNNVYQSDPKFSNQFDYNETVNAAGIDYSTIFSKKVSLRAGLRAEQTISDGASPTERSDVKNNYIDLFPSFNLTDKADNDNILHLAFDRQIYRPFYTDLNPFIAYQDQYSYYMGNPYLKPVYLNIGEFQYIYKNKLSAILRYTLTTNFIQSIFTQNDSTKIIVTKKMNLGNRYRYQAILSDQFDLTNWWNANAVFDISYERFKSTSAQNTLDVTGVYAIGNLKQFFTLSKSVNLEFDNAYEAPTNYGIDHYEALYTSDLAMNKVINKQAILTLKVDDIFNTDRSKISSTYQNLNLTANDKIDFRVIMLSFTYKFGSKTIKAERARKTGAEPEQTRARD